MSKEIKNGSSLPQEILEAKHHDGSNVEKKELSPSSFSTYYYLRSHESLIVNYSHSAIHANSRVVVSASEYKINPSTDRFIGAESFQTWNVAHYNGGFHVWANVNWSTPLNIRIDAFVDPS